MQDRIEQMRADRFSRVFWVDVSPVRPDEWEHVELYPWIECEQMQRAWKDGVADAEDERAARSRQRSA